MRENTTSGTRSLFLMSSSDRLLMEGIITDEELGRVPVRTIRATSKPSPYRGQSSGITARGTEPQGVMVRGHEGPWRVPSTHVVLRAGLL